MTFMLRVTRRAVITDEGLSSKSIKHCFFKAPVSILIQIVNELIRICTECLKKVPSVKLAREWSS